MKALKSYIPEIYFVIATLYYWSLTTIQINWIAIGLLVALGSLIFTKNKVLGIVIGSLLVIINLFLFLALFSEFSEFTSFNAEAKELLFVGSLFLGLNLLFSTLLLYKYANMRNQKKLAAKETV